MNAIVSGKPVRVRDIRKEYGAVIAVDNVSLQVEAGEFLTLLGPSGSGKTTLLMMIAGFEPPNSGQIMVGASDFTHTPPNKRGIGMVFQKYALFPHMTVAENISFPLRMRKMVKAEISDRVQRALDLVRLDGFGDRTPAQLSGGQQQRIAVARALVFEPPVLLMDEPLGALDKKLREEMQIEIKAIQECLGVTVIYVTHDQEEALTMSDRVAVLNQGRIVQLGSPEALYNQPMTPFVADFVGKTNFIDAIKTIDKNGKHVLRVGDDTVIKIKPERLQHLDASNVDQSVTIAIRPEHIELLPNGSPASASVPGIVRTVVFVGSHQQVIVDLPNFGKLELLAHLPVSENARLHKGQAVHIVLDPDRFSLFPAGAD